MSTRKKKKDVVVAVFETRQGAEQAMTELRKSGFTNEQIGMVARNADGRTVRTEGDDETYADEGAVAGAVAGAGVGALVGIGVLSGAIPVIGPVLAIGALGTVLLNAVGGAVIVGIAGALIGWGIPEDEAEYYESEVKAGRFLVTVEADGRADEARRVLNRFGGFDRTGWNAVRADREFTGRTMPLREEQLRSHKTTEPAGKVNVRKEVHTERKSVTVPVEREEVVIERRPASGRSSGGDLKAEEIRIPVKEEKVKVSKEAVVKEEVNIGKRKVRDNKTVSDDVRSEELVVESEGGAKVRQTGNGGRRR
ncbi:MAG TPA: YsnF/AvaK domain-containing protein [Fimbriiglobus sp.]|nr:YsnF/AvaK domain-containing protein [Fimbriiglobus sp.]